ncbi:DMT family transporter [Brevibacillus choshinensis]|uniref:EamA family transporter n=1 Tax=Brevibacillus choshinensis TaxID=54911 RepID=A0ABX7FH59_BRECH|nr:EamA family transporter [Brevibacillus choshinensis]QRG65190.1 EamA family transporter [Brevibacillus choshinensis]
MHKLKYACLIVVTTFLMGIAFPVGKIGLAYAPPFLLMGIRFVVAGGLLALLCAKRQQPQSLKQWLQSIVIGLLQSAGVMGCVFFSMRWITSSESAILTSTSPLIVILLGTFVSGAVYQMRQWFGVVIGLVGVAVAVGFHLGLQPGTFISIAGAVIFATATLLIKRWAPNFDRYVLAAYQMLAGGLALLMMSMVTEQPFFTVTAGSVTVVLWLSIMCSIVQFSLWFYLLHRGDPAKTSSFLFLVPLFGVLTSWLLLGERIEWYVGAGGLLIGTGIFLVNWEGARLGAITTRRMALHSKMVKE